MKRSRTTESNPSVLTESAVLYLLLGFLLIGFLISCDNHSNAKQHSESVNTTQVSIN